MAEPGRTVILVDTDSSPSSYSKPPLNIAQTQSYHYFVFRCFVGYVFATTAIHMFFAGVAGAAQRHDERDALEEHLELCRRDGASLLRAGGNPDARLRVRR